MFVVVARFTAKPGSEDEVKKHLREMVPHSLSEPGCRMYTVNQLIEDPRVFVLYEQYDDEAAFGFHRETQAFNDIVQGKVAPLLDERKGETCRLIEPADSIA